MSATGLDANAIAWNREALAPGSEQDAVIKGITGEVNCGEAAARSLARNSDILPG